MLPFQVPSVVGVGRVEMGLHYRYLSTEMVQVVVEVLLQQLSIPAVVLPDIGLSVPVGIVLWGLVGSFQALQVVL